jgi:hypothetical protein
LERVAYKLIKIKFQTIYLLSFVALAILVELNTGLSLLVVETVGYKGEASMTVLKCFCDVVNWILTNIISDTYPRENCGFMLGQVHRLLYRYLDWLLKGADTDKLSYFVSSVSDRSKNIGSLTGHIYWPAQPALFPAH